MVSLDVGDLVGHSAPQPTGVAAVDAEGGAGHFDGAAGGGPGTDIAKGVALAADLIPILAVTLVRIELGVEVAGCFLAVAAHLSQGGGVGAVIDREANGAGTQGVVGSQPAHHRLQGLVFGGQGRMGMAPGPNPQGHQAQGQGREPKGLWRFRRENLGQGRQGQNRSSGRMVVAHRLRVSGPDGPEIGS